MGRSVNPHPRFQVRRFLLKMTLKLPQGSHSIFKYYCINLYLSVVFSLHGVNCNYALYASHNTTSITNCLFKCRDDFNCKVFIFGNFGSPNCLLLNNSFQSNVLQLGQTCVNPLSIKVLNLKNTLCLN